MLQGLCSRGFPDGPSRDPKGGDWLESAQQPSGAWGETCRSYDDPAMKGTGEPTPSQTAWAILGLIAAGRAATPAARRGIEYLCQTQLADGSWEETQFTGTGFPRVFYLRYHYYRVYFPLMAIARYQAAVDRDSATTAQADGRDPRAEPVSRAQPPSSLGPTTGRAKEAHADAFPLPMTTRIAGYVARKRLLGGQEVPHGPDARAAARLQPDLHRLRADP